MKLPLAALSAEPCQAGRMRSFSCLLVAAAAFHVVACNEESAPPSPLEGEPCAGKDTVCAGDREHVLYCDGDTWKDGVACEASSEENTGFVCMNPGEISGRYDPGVAACGRDFTNDLAFGLEGGSCTARESVGICTTDPRRFLACTEGVLSDPCPPGFALPVDCADVENVEDGARSIQCVDAGQRCVAEGNYHCIAGTGVYRCEEGLLVEVDPHLCVDEPVGCDDRAPYTHLICGRARSVRVAEAGKACDASEWPTCSGDRADLLTCDGGVWVPTACPTRCTWPVEYDPPSCE